MDVPDELRHLIDDQQRRQGHSPFKNPMEPWPYRPLSTVFASPRFYVPFMLSMPICLLYYFCVTTLLRGTLISERRKAWVLTLLSALVMIIGASPLALEFATLPSGATIADHPSLDSDRAWSIASFFIGYLLTDLTLGCIVYPSQIHPLSGWFHHIGYAYCVVSMMQRAQIGAFLSFAAILEVPTIPLALGHMNKEWRRDYTFGLLFFITRVVLHTYVVMHAYSTYRGSIFVLVPFIPLPLHIYWFYGWVRQQMRLGRLPRNSEAAAALSEAAVAVAKVAGSDPAPSLISAAALTAPSSTKVLDEAFVSRSLSHESRADATEVLEELTASNIDKAVAASAAVITSLSKEASRLTKRR